MEMSVSYKFLKWNYTYTISKPVFMKYQWNIENNIINLILSDDTVVSIKNIRVILKRKMGLNF